MTKRGGKQSKEHVQKRKKALEGKKYKPMSEQGKANIRASINKYYENSENRKKISISMKKYYEEHPDAAKERANTPEARANNSAARKKYFENPENRTKLSVALRGRNKGDKNSSKRLEVRKKIALSVTKSWEKPERVAKQIQANCTKPNRPEKFLDKLFQQLFPNQIKYTGDGKDENSIVAGKCPDFIFIDGQKKIIELFGDYWHGEGKTGVPNEQHEQERIDFFALYGYQTLIIWEHELENVEELMERISDFTNKVV